MTLCGPEEILEMIHMSKVIVFLCQKKCQIWSECRKCQHLIATEIGITKISSNHSTKVCGAIDGIHYCCSSYALQVEDGSQIDQEIGYCADSFSFSNVSLPENFIENFTQNLKKKKKLTKEYIKTPFTYNERHDFPSSVIKPRFIIANTSHIQLQGSTDLSLIITSPSFSLSISLSLFSMFSPSLPSSPFMWRLI